MLDNRHQHDNAVHRLLVSLSAASYKMPLSLFVKGVRLLSDTAEFGGGFADVFCGMYKGEKVGLKRLRIFGTENMRREVYHVF